tara:strand:+ start:754 stop:1125 length:372 start_codon:yes stop_codon:yes gene_type:complete
MASELRVNTLKDASGNNSIATSVVHSGTAKAWGILDGTGTVGITNSYNCASITDNSTGDYTVTYANAFDSANHSSTMTVGDGCIGARCNGGRTTTTVNYQCLSTSFGVQDDDFLSLTCHGDLA